MTRRKKVNVSSAIDTPSDDEAVFNGEGTDAEPTFDSPTRPDVQTPELQSPDVRAPDVKTPDIQTPAEDAAAGVERASDLTRTHLRGLLEALVFASDQPMKAGELARLASAPVKQVKEMLEELRAAYAEHGMVLSEVAGGWLFRTNVQYAPFVRELTSERPVRLTRAQIETLAIAAYRQPITRPEIDDIRGVDSGATLKLLLERDLVRILGKKDEPGRPILYGTTGYFLEFFGLKSLKDLPTLREFTELNEDSRRVAEAELGEVFSGQVARDTVVSPAPPAEGRDTLSPATTDISGDPEAGPASENLDVPNPLVPPSEA